MRAEGRLMDVAKNLLMILSRSAVNQAPNIYEREAVKVSGNGVYLRTFNCYRWSDVTQSHCTPGSQSGRRQQGAGYR